MSNAEIVPYDVDRHRNQLYELYLEYGTWTKNAVSSKYGINYEGVIGGTIEQVGARIFPVFTSLKPPEGIILILEVEGKAAGISSEYRGRGYGKVMLEQLEEKAREFGYSTLRLDTGAHNEAAQHIYRRAGFTEREYYNSSAHGRVAKNETEDGHIYYENKVYMEKKL